MEAKLIHGDCLEEMKNIPNGSVDMIEKARQWINLHFRQVCTPKEIKHDFESKEKMWKSFTQFMED